MKLSEKAEEILEAMWIAAGGARLPDGKIGVAADDPAFQNTGLAFIEIRRRVYFRRRETGGTQHYPAIVWLKTYDGRPNIRGESGDGKACQFEHLLNEGVDAGFAPC